MLEEATVRVRMKAKFLQQPEVLEVQGTFSLLHTLQFTEQTGTGSGNRSAQEPADALSQRSVGSNYRPVLLLHKAKKLGISFIMTDMLIRTEKLRSVG